jgi:hypothetical protein
MRVGGGKEVSGNESDENIIESKINVQGLREYKA